jgi:hypothetical protein
LSCVIVFGFECDCSAPQCAQSGKKSRFQIWSLSPIAAKGRDELDAPVPAPTIPLRMSLALLSLCVLCPLLSVSLRICMCVFP